MRLQHAAATGQVTGGGARAVGSDLGNWRDHEIAALYNVLAVGRAPRSASSCGCRSIAIAVDYSLALAFWQNRAAPILVHEVPQLVVPLPMGVEWSEGGDLVIGHGYTYWPPGGIWTGNVVTGFHCAMRPWQGGFRDVTVDGEVMFGRDPSSRCSAAVLDCRCSAPTRRARACGWRSSPPPPLAPGMTEPVPPVDPTLRHQLRLLRIAQPGGLFGLGAPRRPRRVMLRSPEPQEGKLHPWPKHVLLEVTNACDLACRHCHFHGEGVVKTRPVGSMATATWRAAVAEIAGWGCDVTIQPWGMGEPLLHPELWAVVRAAKAHPRIGVGFYSNGMQWTRADHDAAVDSGLDWVCFSVDGLDPEQFAAFRKGADLARVVDSIESLVATRERAGAKSPRVRINMVAYDGTTTPVATFVERWRGIADAVTVSRFREIGSRRFSPVELARVPCYQLDTILAVAWNGRVAMCCEDPQVSEPVGTFPGSSLAEIWNGERMRLLREAHRAGDFAVSRLCVDCDAWTGIYGRDGRAPGMLVTERTAATIYEYVADEAVAGGGA